MSIQKNVNNDRDVSSQSSTSLYNQFPLMTSKFRLMRNNVVKNPLRNSLFKREQLKLALAERILDFQYQTALSE